MPETTLPYDHIYMSRCLQLARCGLFTARPNPMVGAVLVLPDEGKDSGEGRIVGEGYHVRYGEGHAEVNCFASVKPEDEAVVCRCTLYVSLEPCSHHGKTPPCADLIIKKGVRRVVVGCVDTFAEVSGRGIEKLRQAGIGVTVGVMEEECRRLNKRFFTFHGRQRPFIILKWAQTANGFIDDGGRPLRLSTPFTQMLVHKLRAEEDCILVGRVTDEREHPQLTVRHWHGPDPERIVVDRNHPLRLDVLHAHGIQSLIVEGGAKTLNRFIGENLWDEMRVETSPLYVGGGTRAPEIPPSAQLCEQQCFDGNDIRLYCNRSLD